MRTVIGFAAASVVFGLAALAAADEGKETKVDLDDLPEAVVDEIEEEFEGAKIRAAEKGMDDGETFYEVEIKQGERSLDVVLDEDGEIEEVAREIDADDLPKAVTAALNKKFRNPKIREAEKVREYEDDDDGDDSGDAKAKSKDDDEDDADDDDDKPGKKQSAGDDDDDDDDDRDGKKDKDDAEDDDDEDEEGEVSYEVELVTADGKMLEVEVSADGREIEVEATGDDGEEGGARKDDDRDDDDGKKRDDDDDRGEKDDN